MTREEHLLVIAMLSKQYQMIRVLFDILKSNGIAAADDFRAFESVAIQDESANADNLRRMRIAYKAVADDLGVVADVAPPT